MREGAPGSLRVALVGPCAVGKSTVATALRKRGWQVRLPAQEHSGVPDMWRRLSRPDVLIYLDASLSTIREHRPRMRLGPAQLAELEVRLAHAKAHADLVHCVDGEPVAETVRAVEAFLASHLPGSARLPDSSRPDGD